MTDLADAVLARVVKQRDLLAAMHEHCQSISARVTSRDRTVSVEVDGFGAMTGLWLSSRAGQLGSEALATLIVETAAAAAQHALERQRFLTSEFAARMRDLQATPLPGRDVVATDPH